MPAIEELPDAYERYVLDNEDGFMDEFRRDSAISAVDRRRSSAPTT